MQVICNLWDHIASGSPLQEPALTLCSLFLAIPTQGYSETTHSCTTPLLKPQTSYLEWVKQHEQVFRWVSPFVLVFRQFRTTIPWGAQRQVQLLGSAPAEYHLTHSQLLITHRLALLSHLDCIGPNLSLGSLCLIGEAELQPLSSN